MLNNFFHNLHNYFSFTKKERIGFYVLTFVLLLIISSPLIVDRFVPGKKMVQKEDAAILDSLVALMESSNQPDYFYFDPNKVSKDSLLLLGVSNIASNNWIKYREAGGVFYDSTDIAKIYGLKPKVRDKILPYANYFDDKRSDDFEYSAVFASDKEDRPEKSSVTVKKSFDINTASKEELKSVYGIGEVLSLRIVKYRELLGGFVSKNQYQNVYGLGEEAIENLKEHTFISSDFIPHKINVNKGDYKSILRHPYVSKDLTDNLFEVRNSEDSILTQQKFKELINNDSVFFLVLPYIEF